MSTFVLCSDAKAPPYQTRTPKEERSREKSEPLRISLSRTSKSPLVPDAQSAPVVAVDSIASATATMTMADSKPTDEQVAMAPPVVKKEKPKKDITPSVETKENKSHPVSTANQRVVEQQPHSKPAAEESQAPPSLNRTDSDSWRSPEGRKQQGHYQGSRGNRSFNPRLQLSTTTGQPIAGPQSAPLVYPLSNGGLYSPTPAMALDPSLSSPIDLLPPAFIPGGNPYAAAAYMPIMPGQMLMMTGNGLYVPAQPMHYGYYQGSGYVDRSSYSPGPPPLVQSTSFDSTHSSLNAATRSPRFGSRAIPIKAPTSLGSAKKSGSPPMAPLAAAPQEKPS